ncbi:PulJ/GspJ family protein [Adhaeretor mobilis]|uniref:PulJ/GspJ family protein n=1 Tax=Adhaeretor mobilis TaxID=1930276 RepID=UPI001C54F18B|nr:hypothetical protein [Adhaeretor mobilis]
MRSASSTAGGLRHALTLVEMLVGMAITLVMMAAVVNLFANISGGVRVRRAAIEMDSTLRQARKQLKRDLAGATCPAVPWQNPESGNGYIEIIEGQWSDSNPSSLVDGDINGANGELDYATSLIPTSQRVDTSTGSVTDGGGLGDYDDILALTVRSSGEPFVGPGQIQNAGGVWVDGATESTEAEVIWYCIENPADGSLGEAGLRTVYRRTLLIAPWIPPITFPNNPAEFFQKYDISAHFDITLNQWVPNTLSDLTKRENRFFRSTASIFPHVLLDKGTGFSVNTTVSANVQRNPADSYSADATVTAITDSFGQVSGYSVQADQGGVYDRLPLINIPGGATAPTARPVMQRLGSNPDSWKIAHVTNGPSPLTYDREGEDVILNDVLAWDVRAFDPSAPLISRNGIVLAPGDFGWQAVVKSASDTSGFDTPATNSDPAPYAWRTVYDGLVGYGAFVDLGWYVNFGERLPVAPSSPIFWGNMDPRSQLASFTPRVYDTWSTHYEADGLDQDNNSIAGLEWRNSVDQGTNGFDDNNQDGVDDASERETSPPYDVPLPALKIIMRSYERDSRQIRETSVTQSF